MRANVDVETLNPDLIPIWNAMQSTKPDDRAAWDMAVSLCSEAIESKDAAYWVIGDAANLIATQGKYGENAIGKFAEDIGERVTRVREWRTVARFWDFQRRLKFLDSPLRYSHFRTAMRLKENADAFLDECLSNDWKPEAAYVEMRKRKGQSLPPVTLLDAAGTIERYDPLACTITLQLAAGANWWPVENAMRNKAVIQVIIREESSNE